MFLCSEQNCTKYTFHVIVYRAICSYELKLGTIMSTLYLNMKYAVLASALTFFFCICRNMEIMFVIITFQQTHNQICNDAHFWTSCCYYHLQISMLLFSAELSPYGVTGREILYNTISVRFSKVDGSKKALKLGLKTAALQGNCLKIQSSIRHCVVHRVVFIQNPIMQLVFIFHDSFNFNYILLKDNVKIRIQCIYA